MALLELILGSVYYGQQCVNRFTYQSSGTPASVSLSFALWSAFGFLRDAVANPTTNGYSPTAPFGRIRDIAAGAIIYQVGSARDLYSTTDFYEGPIAGSTYGLRPGEPASPVLAWGFRSARTRTDVARATKRFAGVSEGDVGAGGLSLITGSPSPMNFVAVALSQTLTYDDEGNTLSFAPVVLGKQRYNPDTGLPSDTGRAYRLYPTEAAQLAMVASTGTWAPYDYVRTQVSRQYGRGQ